MTTREARLAAEAWVRAEVADRPDLVGAVLAGSTRTRTPDAPHPAGSDVDIFIFVEAEIPSDIHEPRGRFAPRKLAYRDVVLEPSFHDARRIADAGAVAGDMHLASILSQPVILLDPHGRLEALAASVAPEVLRRSRAHQRLEQALAAALPGEPYAGVPDAPGLGAPCWRNVAHAFAIMRCAMAVLVAGLVPPTTRRSFIVARDVLRQSGQEPLADELLRLLGSLGLSRSGVEALVEEAERTYDVAVAVRHTPVAMEWNASRDARALEHAAVREMVDTGCHREAVFQLLLVRTVAQGIIENDADDATRLSSRRGYKRLLRALGLDGEGALEARGREVRAFMPVLRTCCESLLAHAPGLVD